MTHQRMMDRAPSCVILHNRNELKLYQGNQVYLNNGDNFELRFFNPLPEKIGVEINFNGIKKGDAYLVLNPGQDIILDRFLDEQRKMLFETYVVDGNNETAVKAIEQNGVMTFNFYKEISSNRREKVSVNYNFPPVPIQITNNYYNNGNGTYGWSGLAGTSGSSGTSGLAGNTFTSLNMNGMGNIQFSKDYWFPTTTTNISNINQNDRIYGTYTDSLETNLNSSIAYSEYLAESTGQIDYDYIQQKPLETGRIEKGDISSQTLKGVNLNFNSIAFHTITYKLMPISAMNRTIGEIRQYCTHCGYRIRKNTWDYCPKCGSHLD